MSRKLHRRRGGQPGNQNARKHGFYSCVVTPDMRTDLAAAGTANGFDNEIALTRAKIKSIVKHDLNNSAVLLRALNLLARLVRARSQLPGYVPPIPTSPAMQSPPFVKGD